MNLETTVAIELLNLQAEIDSLFTGFTFRLKELPEVTRVQHGYGWHNPNFRGSAPHFYASATAWLSDDTGFSWALAVRLAEDKWMIIRQVRKQYRSGSSDIAVDLPLLESGRLIELKQKVVQATNELIESAGRLGLNLSSSNELIESAGRLGLNLSSSHLTPEPYDLSHAPDNLEAQY